ncbi:HAMP domain-containing sensor histidine kinase [Bacillus sp. JJ1764]|uniref:HAMP domain-containing sensor histidine kinase n=1 Tax=Bacillus sp. JJ1764 TaxID=3122964 RepID=UPI002FFEAF8C
MVKKIQSFRSKMIQLAGLSMLLAGTITYLIYKFLQLYYHKNAQFGDQLSRFRSSINNFGDLNFFLIIFIPQAIFYFFLFTKRYALYFEEISKGIHHLANGNFQHHVTIPSSDEFSKIAQDINTASEKLQYAVERGEFAESSKDQLVVNLAHDLRTPLTSVLGYLDWILKDEQLKEEQIRHYAAIAYTKSQRLEKLINELFEITRMNYGMIDLEKSKINISELLLQLNEEMYPIYEKNQLTSRMDLEESLFIEADGEQLARVFENLLINASRYGKDGKFIDIKGFHDEGDVVVQVINYGDFIPQEELPYIFDIFYTSDRARTHQEGSTGLGLFIAKNIVEQHMGSITAESSVIRTSFEVRLPQDVPKSE